MGWMQTGRRQWLVLTVCLAAGFARTAAAIYLDEEQLVSLRTRIYSQLSFRAEGSSGDTHPSVKPGQVVQHRNFFNPELEAKLASYATWMGPLAPDALDFRLAGRAFYDGIYDYGTSQFNDARRGFAKANGGVPIPGKPAQTRYSEVTSLQQVFTGTDDVKEARDIYGYDRRVNELYLSYSKGPLFVRFGKQAISWGESDTIAILDQNNPFDLTLGAPGVFEDLDEARIPLWTLRTSYALFDTLGPLSSGFIEAYWVPGDLDTTTAITPLLTQSPYSVPGRDPAFAVPSVFGDVTQCGNPNFANRLCFVFTDHVPAPEFGNSRWGVRAQTVVARDYTVSAWFYTAFPNAGVPRIVGKKQSALLPPGYDKVFLIEFVHQLVPVVGISNTFFFAPLDGIVRMEAEYFNREPAFIPQENLLIPSITTNIAPVTKCFGPNGTAHVCNPNNPSDIPPGGTTPHASFLRWELGFDRFFFVRALNPTNSFTMVTAIVGQYNMDETSQRDFRYLGVRKPNTDNSTRNSVPGVNDFVQLQKVDAFWQMHLQSDYLHGRLTPAATVIVNRLGTWAVPFDLTYRWTDSLLFDFMYVGIGGNFSGLGFFRDRDQIALRATYQLN
jgi:uncharacterized protein DUF1302